MSTAFRPRRSCLYMPGANARALDKARDLPADVLVLDLEDAVSPDSKPEARDAVAAAVSARAYGRREVLVRINGLETPWGKDDLQAAVAAGADGILVPKVTDAPQVRDLDAALEDAGAAAAFGLWAMIEMPLAILNIGDIAASAASTRLTGFVVGTNDLAKELNAVPTPAREAFQVYLALTLAAARAHGLAAIDGVYNDFRDEAGFVAECEQGRLLGFDGKSLIHPAQIEGANRVFAPAADDIAHARAVIAAFDEPGNRGVGVIEVDGRMTEILHLEQARALVALEAAIAAMEQE